MTASCSFEHIEIGWLRGKETKQGGFLCPQDPCGSGLPWLRVGTGSVQQLVTGNSGTAQPRRALAWNTATNGTLWQGLNVSRLGLKRESLHCHIVPNQWTETSMPAQAGSSKPQLHKMSLSVTNFVWLSVAIPNWCAYYYFYLPWLFLITWEVMLIYIVCLLTLK